jgi:integrase
MASIDKRVSKTGVVSYRVKIRIKGQHTETATHARKTDAQTWARQVEADMVARRHFGASKRHTLAELLDRYEASELPKLKSEATVKPRLSFWRGRHGKTLLSDLTPDVIAKARDRLRATPKRRGGGARSAADVNRMLAVLSSVCGYAVTELQWLDRNPLERVKKGMESRGRVRYLDENELKRFLQSCRESDNSSLYLAVLLSLTTGGRQSEIMGLRWSQVDLEKRQAVLADTKNGQARSLPLSGEVPALLADRAKLRNIMDNRLFPPKLRPDGKPNTKSRFLDLRRPFANALAIAEIGEYVSKDNKRRFVPNFRWHDLRHTAASYMAMNGTTPLEISKVLGHKTMAMVSRYSHLSPDHVVRIGDRLANSLGVGTH